jgi:hypothetical protein
LKIRAWKNFSLQEVKEALQALFSKDEDGRILMHITLTSGIFVYTFIKDFAMCLLLSLAGASYHIVGLARIVGNAYVHNNNNNIIKNFVVIGKIITKSFVDSFTVFIDMTYAVNETLL